MTSSSWYTLMPVVAVSALAPVAAHATTFMSVAEAQRYFFPAASGFADRSLTLTPAQRKAISTAAKAAPGKTQRVFEARGAGGRLGWLFIDQVLGKHEMITYALALDPTGVVKGIEILDYRETYGGEIRNPNWRRQFAGKSAANRPTLGKDIKNISGATLSSRHVTDGVRRLLVTFQMLFAGK